MITQFPTRQVVALCLVFILASIGLTLYVWRSVGGPIPFEAKGYEVSARFTNASQLVPNADVRVAGVNIGKVVEVRSRGLRTEAVMTIAPQYAPLPRDVRAILRQKTLLGETFVALSQGSPDGPRMADGGEIPAEQIESTQPLDRVLSTLDAKGRERLHEMLVDTGTMFAGRAEDISDATGNLATGARELETTAALLDAQRDDVSTLVARVGEVLQTVGDRRASVARLVGAGNRALAATAARDDELAATVRAAPALLRELRSTSRAVERTARIAAPVLREFKPLAPKIAPTLKDLEEASPEIEGLLTGLEALTPVARKALPAAGKIVSSLGPFMERLQPAAQQVVPILNYIAAYRTELISAMANVGASLKGKAPGITGKDQRYIRTIIPLGPELLVGASGRLGSNRHNAYVKPGGLSLLKEGFESSNCKHAKPELLWAAPPCKTSGGWSFEGGPKRHFQHLTEKPVVPPEVKKAGRLFG